MLIIQGAYMYGAPQNLSGKQICWDTVIVTTFSQLFMVSTFQHVSDTYT